MNFTKKDEEAMARIKPISFGDAASAAMRLARWVFADKKAEHALARLGELQGDLF